MSVRVESFHDGALAPERNGNFNGLCVNVAPDVKFFFQKKLLFDDEPLLNDGKDRDAILGADFGNLLDSRSGLREFARLGG